MAEETFGKRLKRLREQAELTQQQLADQADIHRITVAKLEQDLYGPSWATVQLLAKALGVGCSAFEGTVEPSKEPKPTRKRGRPRKQPPPAEPEPGGEAEPAKARRKGKR